MGDDFDDIQLGKKTQQLFFELDTNKDGKISQAELCSYYARTVAGGCTIAQAASIIAEINGTTGSRSLEVDRTSFYYFKRIAEAGTGYDELDTLKEWHQEFLRYDGDKNGLVSLVELKKAFLAVGVELEDDELKEMIQSVDLDGNGEIDFLEFIVLMKNRKK